MPKIPQELIARKQWVLWKNVTRDEKTTKLPFQVNGKSAKTNDSSTWNTFENIMLAPDGFDGPGFVFSPDDPYVGIDLDGCRNPETGKVSEWAREIILRFNSYAEVSPSKTGVKIFAAGEWKFDGGRKCNVNSEKVCEKLPGIEVYSQKRYFAVTGIKLAKLSENIEHRQDAIDWLVNKYFVESSRPTAQSAPLFTDEEIIKRASRYLEKIPHAVSGQRGHDRTFQAACVLVLGFGLPTHDALVLLSEWNQGCDPPWTQRELEHKVQDAIKQTGPRNYLRDVDPVEWDKVSVPRYGKFETEAKAVLKIETLEDAAKSFIQEYADGKKESLISTGLSELDASLAGGYELGEMIILAARPSHGKSAFALQMAHAANQQQLPGIIISEEMSTRQLGKRVVQFVSEVPQEDWGQEHGSVKYDLFEHFKGRSKTFVIESCGTTQRAVEEIEKAVEDRGVKFAIVDYSQLLRNEGKGRYEQTTNTSIALKTLAIRLKIAMICLCQLSRNIENRANFIPTMADVKETGQFEQDADVILFLVWPHKVCPNNPANEYQVFVGKNKNRAITDHALTLHFNPSRQMVIPPPLPADTSGWPSEGFGRDY